MGGLSINMYPLPTNGIFPHEALGISHSCAHSSGSFANEGEPAKLRVSWVSRGEHSPLLAHSLVRPESTPTSPYPWDIPRKTKVLRLSDRLHVDYLQRGTLILNKRRKGTWDQGEEGRKIKSQTEQVGFFSML